MNEDGVLQEVRKAREAYARMHGFNVHAIVADLRERDARGDMPVVRLAPRRPIIAGESRTGPNDQAQKTPVTLPRAPVPISAEK